MYYVRARTGEAFQFNNYTWDRNVETKEETCPACDIPFVEGDQYTLVPIGPGEDRVEQERCDEDRFYNAVAILVHYTCATGR